MEINSINRKADSDQYKHTLHITPLRGHTFQESHRSSLTDHITNTAILCSSLGINLFTLYLTVKTLDSLQVYFIMLFPRPVMMLEACLNDLLNSSPTWNIPQWYP